jgi:hypothetical protein
MIPLSTLLSRIRTRYEAEAGVSSPVRWTDAEITKFVNEGLESLAESTGFYERYCTIPCEANRVYYDLRGFTPETVSRIKSIWCSNRNDWLKPETPENLDFTWEQATGDPLVFFTRGIYWIGLYPHPVDSTGYLRVYFEGIPGRFTHTQAVLGDLPDQYYPALEDYALYEMASLDGESQRAIAHFQAYVAREKALRNYMDRRLVASTAGRLGRLAGRL